MMKYSTYTWDLVRAFINEFKDNEIKELNHKIVNELKLF